MTLVVDSTYVEKEKHMKGYLMMEVVPHDTANMIFLKKEY